MTDSRLPYKVITIYTTYEYDYEKRDLTYTEEEMISVMHTLDQYTADFDILNNPYVEYIDSQI